MMKANESGIAKSSEYPVRPGTKDCQFYLETGRCGFGKYCRYNHPKEIPPKKINMPKCKYFLRGKCRNGSKCQFDHSNEGDGAEHMPQGHKRHRTESRSRSRSRSWPSPEKREGIEKQSAEAQENLQEEKLKEMQENDNEQQRKRDIERQRIEARLRLEQVKQTVHFDDAIRIRKTLTELGFILTEGDGF